MTDPTTKTRADILRNIDLHRSAVAKHLAKKRFHAATSAQCCLDRAEWMLRQLDEASA